MSKPGVIVTDAAGFKKSLKIGFVLDDTLDTPDGVQQYVLTLGNWFSSQGHDVSYLVGQTKRADIPQLHSLSRNLRVRFNGNRMSIPLPTSRLKLRRLLKAEQFDVLHVQMPYSPLLGARLVMAAPQSTAIVGTFHIAPHSRLVHHANKALALALRRSLKRFDTVVSVSSAAQAFAKHTFGLKTTIVPNVVDYQRFQAGQRLPRYADDQLTILFLGRLVPRKGCRLLLEAITRLRQDAKLPKFRVLICGKGPLASSLKQYAVSHQLNYVVEFVGYVSEADKPDYYASADIAVFPSNGGESFGIVLLEAMAAGRALVLAGDNPGYRSVLALQPALLFDPFDPEALAAKLAEYMRQTSVRQQAQAWGEAYAADFDTGVVGKRLEAVYSRALRKRLRP